MNILPEKQLRNLNTPRLNNIRKSVLKARAAAEHEAERWGFSGDIERAAKLAEYYNLIKEVMSTREHIESETKPKQRPRSRDTIRRMAA
jgi:hypothetical protein